MASQEDILKAHEAETILNKPVTASNHAMAWHMIRLAKINDEIRGQGRLFHL